MKTRLMILGLLAPVAKVGYDAPSKLPSRKNEPQVDELQKSVPGQRWGPPRPSTQAMRARLVFSDSPPKLPSQNDHSDVPDPLSALPTTKAADGQENRQRMSSHTGQNKQSVETGSVLESFAYSKGDQAKTIKEFKQALKGDYTVSFNGNARNAEKFLRRITVYGENHIQPNLPSIPSDRGLIMFESQDPERCIKKYMAYESNRCISIDQPDLSSESTALGRLKSAYISVLDEIGPQAVAQVEAQLGVRATVQEFMLKALHYATTKMSEISASGDEDRLNRIMEKMETAAEVSAQSRMKVESRIGVRDDHMFEQAASNIRNLSNDEAATIVVGDNHADKLFARLNAAFPERAVVKCKVAKEAWPVA